MDVCLQARVFRCHVLSPTYYHTFNIGVIFSIKVDIKYNTAVYETSICTKKKLNSIIVGLSVQRTTLRSR